MRYAAILFLLLAVPCWSRTTATTKNDTSRPCSPITTGSNNNFVINCKIDPEQGKQMIGILNKILANQQKLQPEIVMQKLDEILKAVNPNVPVKTYFCNGMWRTVGPSANAGMEINMGGDNIAFKEMINLNNTHQYAQLLTMCQQQMKSSPEWLTPLLTCSLAYIGQGDKVNASEMLKEFDSRTGPAYAVDACKQMSDFLHAQLGQ
jgi:hypothetical protein